LKISMKCDVLVTSVCRLSVRRLIIVMIPAAPSQICD
jgi:hypothetical protein